ncbi:MAG: diguanylate cyclase [Acinetobacter sp.]|nr:diguanylate cyclase [Acinetobacter sp.]
MTSTEHYETSNSIFLDTLKTMGKLELVSFISKLPVPIAIFDDESTVLGLNQLFADIYESDALYMFGKKLNEFSTVVYALYNDAVVKFNKELYLEQIENEFYSKGHFYILNFRALRTADKAIESIIVVCTDVTRLKRRERVLIQNNKKLHDYLYIDQTTGLKNKIALEEYLAEHFIDGNREKFSFVKIDIEDFKKFNQLNSYSIGDEILNHLGELFSEEIDQDNAQLYRLNSASFIIVLEQSTPWKVLTVAERLRQKISKEQIRFDEITDEILGVTIGIYHPRVNDNFAEIDIMQQLEIAVNQAKEQGKNSIFVLE